MKILNKNGGPLTNFEVYDFLQKKGASLDPDQRVMTKLQQSELKVFDYLVQGPASTQTRESISEFTEKSKEFNLAKADVINITNIRPIDPVEAAPELKMRKGLHPQMQWISYVTQTGRLMHVMMTKIHREPKVYHLRAKKQMTQSIGQLAKFKRRYQQKEEEEVSTDDK